jgi:hypothetical protein
VLLLHWQKFYQKYEYFKNLLKGRGKLQKIITWEDFRRDAMSREDILSHVKESKSNDLDLQEADTIEMG